MAKPEPELLEPSRYPFTVEIPTRFQDVDPNNHVNNVAMAAIFEDMRVRFDHAIKLPELFREHALKTMIVSLQIDYLAEAYYPMPVTAHIGTLSVGRTSWTVAGLAQQGASIACFMRGTVVCVGEAGPTPLPGLLRAAIAERSIRLGR
jgi:acyl-CoA thioester hydrolase